MPNGYNSEFTGQHNDQYDIRITAVEAFGDRIAAVEAFGDRITNLENKLNGTTVIPNTLLLSKGFKTGTQANNTAAVGALTIVEDGGIEIYHNSTPFIDFHYAQDATDYNARILCNGPSSLSLVSSHLSTSYVNSTSWHKVRDASFRSLSSSNGSGAKGHYMLKTRSGSWTLADYNTEGLYFVYCTDANYNANSNTTIQARITPAGAFTNASKREYKENIKAFKASGLDIINSIKICSFNMKGDPEKDYRIGFIADDTDPIVSGKNHDVMDLQNCIGIMMKAIQELSQEVNELKKRLGE